MLLLSHPIGNANVRAVARAFHHAGWLQEFHSCICWDPQSRLARLLPISLAPQFARRSFADVPLQLQHSHALRELLRLGAPSLPFLRRHERGPLSVESVCRSFDRNVADRLPMLPGLNGVYAYEDAALQTFLAARRLGIRTIYDLPIGYWREARRIYEEERELQPAWASTLTGLKDSPAKLARKDEELQLADQVIVPSRFVESTLLNHKACKAPVSVAPFGSPAPVSTLPESDNTSPLRVLFIGSLGQRKGLAYLLEAVHYLDTAVKLTLIGKITSLDCKPLAQALERHHWIETLPNSAILEQMRLHDVLVLPSLFEGYALVISEALSQGLPVIATPNSGATEAVRNGLEGFIVPIRSSESIAECLQQLFKDREKLYFMRQACLTRAAELSWNGYEQSIRQIVGNCLELGSARV